MQQIQIDRPAAQERRRKPWALVAAACVGLAFAALQLVPAPPRTNPPIQADRTIQARLHMTPEAARVLEHACANCHSNATHWPWYSKVAPGSWLLGTHVNNGRQAMNFSDWTPDAARSVATLMAACSNMQSGRMPPASYRLMHPEARVTPAEVQVFCGWAKQQTAQILAEHARARRRSRGEME